WHIMKIYSAHGIHDFIICCGYKGYVIKEYFANYFLHASDLTFDLGENRSVVHSTHPERWRVTLVDTGDASMTGGRLKRVRDHVGDEPFCFTYGDAVADIDLAALLAQHRSDGKLATVTAVQPPGRFGMLNLGPDGVEGFEEKPSGDGNWINGGYFVLEPGVFDYIEGDATHWEAEPMERLVADHQLGAYRHHGFWQPMDTLRDKTHLEQLWATGDAPWRQP
ncbi:MAG TPA: glucose-1-phosphate cytidylyltransferase, partial [Acidimicrobiales bacterium]